MIIASAILLYAGFSFLFVALVMLIVVASVVKDVGRSEMYQLRALLSFLGPAAIGILLLAIRTALVAI